MTDAPGDFDDSANERGGRASSGREAHDNGSDISPVGIRRGHHEMTAQNYIRPLRVLSPA